jgi:hypothetical protein
MVYRYDGTDGLPTPPAPGMQGTEVFPTGGIPPNIPASVIDVYWIYSLCEEIRNVVTGAGITPAKTQVNQLLQALQSGALTFCVDTGIAGNYVVSPITPMTALGRGARIAFFAKAGPNAGGCTLKYGGLGALPFISRRGSNFSGGEIVAGQLVEAVFNGTSWQAANTAPSDSAAAGIVPGYAMPTVTDLNAAGLGYAQYAANASNVPTTAAGIVKTIATDGSATANSANTLLQFASDANGYEYYRLNVHNAGWTVWYGILNLGQAQGLFAPLGVFSNIAVFTTTGATLNGTPISGWSNGGNWTVPASGKYEVTVTGAGGGGGNSTATGTSAGASGSGGAAGGTAIGVYTLTQGQAVAVTVGAGGAAQAGGGTSSFGALASATGGGGGTNGSNAGGGNYGTGTGGNINIYSGNGSDGQNGTLIFAGNGGASYWGGGGRAGNPNGSPAYVYGAGGGGAYNNASGTGGAGAPGIVVVRW